MFVADGPFSASTKIKQQQALSPNIQSQNPLIIKGFRNLEIYGLVAKLLNLTNTAPNNGTLGFWDELVDI